MVLYSKQGHKKLVLSKDNFNAIKNAKAESTTVGNSSVRIQSVSRHWCTGAGVNETATLKHNFKPK